MRHSTILLDIAEGQLYVHVQSGVTLFRDLLKRVFDQQLTSHVCRARVLTGLDLAPDGSWRRFFDSEVAEIKKLLTSGQAVDRTEALAKLRPLAILDSTISGAKGQPSDSELRHRLGETLLTAGKARGAMYFKGIGN